MLIKEFVIGQVPLSGDLADLLKYVKMAQP